MQNITHSSAVVNGRCLLIGVLVSLIKIASLAEVAMGYSFWAFCFFAMLVVKTVSLVDRYWLWQHFIPAQTPQGVNAGQTHCTHNSVSCHTCQQINLLRPDQKSPLVYAVVVVYTLIIHS